MSKHDDQVSLQQMLDYAQEAVGLAQGKTCDDLIRDRLLQLALTRLVEIVGEAAVRVSDETRTRHPEIPWPQIVGMRNRLIHGYDVLDWDLLWNTVVEDLPALIAALQITTSHES